MSMLSLIARYVAQKAASDPVVREKLSKAARDAAGEAKLIVTEKDRAYAAGRAFRRVFKKLQNNQ
jgi:hypothetical protein